MPEKNPYETQNTVEIPTFIGQTPKSAPVTEERAFVREMVQDIQKEEEAAVVEEDYEEVDVNKPRKKRKLNLGGIMTVLSLVLALLCLLLLVGNISKNNALKKAVAEHEAYVKVTETKNAAYEAEIAKLNSEIEAAKNPVVKEENNGTGSRYHVEAEGGIRLRKGPGTNYELFTSFSNLSNTIQGVCNDEGDCVYLNAGATVTVYETSGSGSEVWGRIDNGAWVALRYGGEDWCVPAK